MYLGSVTETPITGEEPEVSPVTDTRTPPGRGQDALKDVQHSARPQSPPPVLQICNQGKFVILYLHAIWYGYCLLNM